MSFPMISSSLSSSNMTMTARRNHHRCMIWCSAVDVCGKLPSQHVVVPSMILVAMKTRRRILERPARTTLLSSSSSITNAIPFPNKLDKIIIIPRITITTTKFDRNKLWYNTNTNTNNINIRFPYLDHRIMMNHNHPLLLSSSVSYYSSSAREEQDEGDIDTDNEENNTTKNNMATTNSIMGQLKNVMKPFLLQCHPDVMMSNNNRKDNNNKDDNDDNDVIISTMKQLNMIAIQNMNRYLDDIRDILLQWEYKKLSKLSTSSTNQSMIELDFVIKMESSSSSKKKSKKSKMKYMYRDWSRRKVELTLPPQHLLLKTSSTPSQQNPPHRIMNMIQYHVQEQLIQLLQAAGLDIPENKLISLSSSDLIYDDHDIDDNDEILMSSSSSSLLNNNQKVMYRRSTTPYEINRERFYQSYSWKVFQNQYNQAVLEHEADIMTEGIISKNKKRKRQFIASLLQNVQIMPIGGRMTTSKQQQEEEDQGGDNSNQEDKVGDYHNYIDSINNIDQLVAIRRLSLLLDQKIYFDLFQLERYSGYWEQGIIYFVFTTPITESSSEEEEQNERSSSNYRMNESSSHDTTDTIIAPSTKWKRSNSTSSPSVSEYNYYDHHNNISDDDDKADYDHRNDDIKDEIDYNQMSSFLYFMFHSNSTVSIHIPINFDIDELIDELDTNLNDIYSMLEKHYSSTTMKQQNNKTKTDYNNNNHPKLFLSRK